MNQNNVKISELIGPQLAKLQRGSLVAAVVGLVLCVVGVFLHKEGGERFFESYLFAYMFWFGITLGSLGFLMVHHVTGGGWGFIIRRMLEAATRNLPLVFAMFVPIAFIGFHHLYEWSDPAHVVGDKVLESKQAYLNLPFFYARLVFYFAVWITLAFFLNKWSRQQNESDDPKLYVRATNLSAGGLVLYILTVTFAVFDWIMSLTPHWFSSLLGVIFIGSQALATLSLMSLLVQKLAGKTDLVSRIEPRYFRDLGNLMLAFTLFWAYTNFSQFLIYWSGNIAEEVEFYTARLVGPWLVIGATICVFHFFFPFFCLLSSSLKVKVENLARLAGFLIVMRHVDLFWYVVPTFRKEGAHDWMSVFYITDIGAPLLLGGLWLWMWTREVGKEMLVPLGDPRLQAHWPLHELEVAHHG
jgi:hypothetical protein